MAFRSVNLNAPRGPRGGGGRGGNNGGGYRSASSGYTTPPVRIDASGRVDQGFGPVGGAAAADDVFDIFGLDDMATTQQTQSLVQAQQPAPILYAPPSAFTVRARSMKYYAFKPQ